MRMLLSIMNTTTFTAPWENTSQRGAVISYFFWKLLL